RGTKSPVSSLNQSVGTTPSTRIHLLLALVGLLSTACAQTAVSTQTRPAPRTTAANVFDDYLKTEFAPADGFDFAVGDRDGKGTYQDKSTGQRYSGWYVATHFPDI